MAAIKMKSDIFCRWLSEEGGDCKLEGTVFPKRPESEAYQLKDRTQKWYQYFKPQVNMVIWWRSLFLYSSFVTYRSCSTKMSQFHFKLFLKMQKTDFWCHNLCRCHEMGNMNTFSIVKVGEMERSTKCSACAKYSQLLIFFLSKCLQYNILK